jgi:hypothetical protein
MAESSQNTDLTVRESTELSQPTNQNLTLSYIQFWSMAWLEFKRSSLYRWVKAVSWIIRTIVFVILGAGLLAVFKFLYPFLPFYGWIIVILTVAVIAHFPAIHYFVKFHQRTTAELETTNGKLLTERAVPRELTLSEIEQRYGDSYEVKVLERNLMAGFEVEFMPAYNDSNGIIMAGMPSENSSETGFYVHTAAISNRSRKNRVAPLSKVAARLIYHDFGNAVITIDRGNWLSEKDREMDFPPNGAPHRLVLATVENGSHVYAIRRDLESGYSGPRAIREELKTDLYKVEVELFAIIAKYHKNLTYILQIQREPQFNIKISRRDVWMTFNLGVLQDAGYKLIFQAYDIGKARHERVMALRFDDPKVADAYAEENQERAHLAEAVRIWEKSAGDFIGLHYGKEKAEEFLNATPTIEQGLQRVRKGWQYRLRLALPSKDVTGEQKSQTTDAPNWDLTDSIDVRIKKLDALIKALSWF